MQLRQLRRRRSLILLLITVAILALILITRESKNLLKNQINAIIDNVLDAADTQDTPFDDILPLLDPVQDLCTALVAKYILFIGPETTYHLHNLWLGALEKHQNISLPCLGPEFCTFHHICYLNATADHHGRNVKYPHENDLRATNSSVLRYVLSTTLHAATDPKDLAYTHPVVDLDTRVRAKNTYWLGHARRADLIIANRGPLPAPAWTYQGGGLKGNWSFADSLYLNSSTAYLDGGEQSLAIRIINAALYATLHTFLPSILHSLDVLQIHSSRQTLLVWHASWYIDPRCSISGVSKTIRIQDPLNRLSPTSSWSLYYNAQVYMQNRIMHRILPYYDGVFYDRWIPDLHRNSYRPPAKAGVRKQTADCLLYAPTTALGGLMQDRFLRGLARLVYRRMLEESL